MIGGRVPGSAVAALAAQVTVAGGSFLVQALGARGLGAEGFGTFALLFGAVVMATAVSSGLVGDSLTVLDRARPDVAAALWRVAGATVTTAAVAAAALAGIAGQPTGRSLLLGLVVATFMAGDLARRVLMAQLRFTRLALVDAAAATTGIAVALVATTLERPTVEHFLVAVLATQLTTLTLVRLSQARPRGARRPRGTGWGDWRAVLGYGSWRALQQFVRPTALNLTRWLVLVAAGQAAVGELEAARLLVAPAMLLIQGLGSYLFSSYAADRAAGTPLLLRRADRGAATMLVGAVLVGSLTALALPLVEELLTAGAYPVTALAVLGWSCYAASCAAVLPYGSLAAVCGRQRLVLGIRVLDSVFSLGLVALALLLLRLDPGWAPWLLSVGSFGGGWVLRRRVLVPAGRADPGPLAERPRPQVLRP